MKTVKEVSEIAGVSIRTLRYYDEAGLLKPAALTEAGYRLYGDKELAKLQQILFFRELDIPVAEIKAIMESSQYDKKQALLEQKNLLEQKRNRLNGLIELINDLIKDETAINFEAFHDEDIKKICDHSLSLQRKASIDAITQQYGSLEAFRAQLTKYMKDEKTNAHFIKMYGSKEKAVAASLAATGDTAKFKKQCRDMDKAYEAFAAAAKANSEELAMGAVEKLAECYKDMFHLDNARYLLLKLAEDYLQGQAHPALIAATDKQYKLGGITAYIGHAIRRYYGM